MIQLHVTIYQTEDGDQFQVYALNGDDVLKDVTDEYDILAVQSESEQPGFAVMKRELGPFGDPRPSSLECAAHPTGAEL